MRVTVAVLLPIVAIAAPWFVMISSNQQEFSSHFFLRHHLERFFSAFNHSEPWWFYLPVLAVALLPGSLLAGPLAVYLFGRGKGAGEKATLAMRSQQLGVVLLAGIWIVSFFSLSSCKLPAYILPAIPMFCLVLGKMLHDVLSSEQALPKLDVFAQRARSLSVKLSMFAGVVAISADLFFAGVDLRWLAVLIPAATILAWAWFSYGPQVSVGKAWLATAVVCLFVSVYGFDYVIPHIADWRSSPRSAAIAQQQLGKPVPVVFFGRRKYGAAFSIPEGEIREFSIEQMDEFEKYMAKNPQVVLVANASSVELIREQTGRLPIKLEKSTTHGKIYIAETADTGMANRPSPVPK